MGAADQEIARQVKEESRAGILEAIKIIRDYNKEFKTQMPEQVRENLKTLLEINIKFLDY